MATVSCMLRKLKKTLAQASPRSKRLFNNIVTHLNLESRPKEKALEGGSADIHQRISESLSYTYIQRRFVPCYRALFLQVRYLFDLGIEKQTLFIVSIGAGF